MTEENSGADDNTLTDPNNKDVRLNFIGDKHYILKADQFDFLLDSSDEILIEVPEEDLGNSTFNNITEGFRNFYKMGGFFLAVLYLLMTVDRYLFGRQSLVWVATHKYKDKLVGIDSSDGRDMLFSGSEEIGLKSFIGAVVLVVLSPRFLIREIMDQFTIMNGEKSSKGQLYADEMGEGLNGNEETEQGNEHREKHMADEIVNHLEEHPEKNNVVVIVGRAHLESIIKKVDERNPHYTIKIANDDIVSEYLENKE